MAPAARAERAIVFDAARAIAYVEAHADPSERERLRALLAGEPPPKRPPTPCSPGSAPTAATLPSGPPTTAVSTPPASASSRRAARRQARRHRRRRIVAAAAASLPCPRVLAGRQQPDGTWQEDVASLKTSAAAVPPWLAPGDPAAGLYLTANCGYWLGALGGPTYRQPRHGGRRRARARADRRRRSPAFRTRTGSPPACCTRATAPSPPLACSTVCASPSCPTSPPRDSPLVTCLAAAGVPAHHPPSAAPSSASAPSSSQTAAGRATMAQRATSRYARSDARAALVRPCPRPHRAGLHPGNDVELLPPPRSGPPDRSRPPDGLRHFIEHLGRCIYGGVYDPAPLSPTSRAFARTSRRHAQVGVPILRWPGGNFASNYHWEDGIGPRDRRPARLRPRLADRRAQHVRHRGIPRLLPGYLDRTDTLRPVHLPQHRHRHARRGGALARVLQPGRRQIPHPPRPLAPPARPHRAARRTLLGHGNEVYGSWRSATPPPPPTPTSACSTLASSRRSIPPSKSSPSAPTSPTGPRVLKRAGRAIDYISIHQYWGADDYYATVAAAARTSRSASSCSPA